jgi:hypothetical protein
MHRLDLMFIQQIEENLYNCIEKQITKARRIVTDTPNYPMLSAQQTDIDTDIKQ